MLLKDKSTLRDELPNLSLKVILLGEKAGISMGDGFIARLAFVGPSRLVPVTSSSTSNEQEIILDAIR